MSDQDFVDVGDELVVRVGGYPVGKATVTAIGDDVTLTYSEFVSKVPLNIKEQERIDGYGHHSQPLDGVAHFVEEADHPVPPVKPLSGEGGRFEDWDNEGGYRGRD